MNRIVATAFLAITLTAAAGQDEAQSNRLIVHEWGTFTAVLGSDGTMMEWKPLIGEDLPSFVHTRASTGPTPDQRRLNSKCVAESYQRMETPVLYFYSEKEMNVDVSVGFPKGLITEWYPRVRDFRPLLGDGSTPLTVADGWVRWGKIRVIPGTHLEDSLPRKGESNHYYHARETDSAYVRVCSTAADREKSEVEKFLFYRGIGNFSLPMKVTAEGGGRFTLTNPGAQDLGHVFVLTIKPDGKGKYQFIEKLKAGDERKVELDVRENWLTKEQLIRRIGEELEECLTVEGLYRKEAKAMVKTWTDSYFETPGTRVLYLLPTSMTEELLPLTIEPKPVELKRVLVARVDIFTPEQTEKVAALVRDLGDDAPEVRDRAMKEIRSYDRFAEPALKEAMRTTTDEEIRHRAKKLINELQIKR